MTGRVLITGANGQLGRALMTLLGTRALGLGRHELDITSSDAVAALPWSSLSAVINCAAYTAVDCAEAEVEQAWAVNATGPALLARACAAHDVPLVHISTDYVFSGLVAEHAEDEPVAPLNVYGASKAAGELAVLAACPNAYVVRTSWVVGDGANFVRTMLGLRSRGITPSVVDDQFGRLTFADDLAAALVELVDRHAEPGIYHFSNSGDVVSWADIANELLPITRVSTAEYYAGRSGIAARPTHSTFDLRKIRAAGISPRDWRVALSEYVDKQREA
ncbi:dTDP-4-dehydrorhamnose reductase [Corynebacterium epidermidicanis]|uniref:dTDP-4-dehydrorhamnose reductase n=1 Tax=Corynebacterium epidermidicanis TaxID=1050174 RepID=A0A0G3GT53_9CORY|nr:dTDP-4-dehydrorhamnose reductase [Corynebacterium epidermidicanis]AKK02042.1 dTDP-4-dehydrorhamnose reductase [Corynebacterium epidermidicanis]